MSLDVYLSRKRWISYDSGKTHTEESDEVFSANITHNLNIMAEKAGIYNAIWRPYRLAVDYAGVDSVDHYYEDTVTIFAKEIAPIIQKGLDDMKARPEYYEQFNPANGWGTYIHFVPWIEKYLDACLEYPDAIVTVSR